ncbi:beta-xylosidase [Enterococcus sp. JM4C]|uniref:glycoside hydrolase family 43 protein n=1 Tax=Candidatus Enterococcus huntleyi TaxID=1857217 RepID=UPI00137A3EE5|nr:glycoside hydrolase family 43 protein [Enterococcus sp. JM4C]KAF1299331.1 beta-xylosidase [Enterococcus sp. JM4C]
MINHYQNPILRGMYPDPSIVRVENTYYMVNSTFEYYPGIALSKSTDLLNWSPLPSIVTETTQADLRQAKSNEGIFAVCIRYHQGVFYVITTNFAEFKNFIICGSLSEDGSSIIWQEQRIEVDIMGIDPDLYFENNRSYVTFTGYIDDQGTKAIQQVEIELDTGQILRGPEVISFGTGGRDVEGPHIIKRPNGYYLLAAEGGTGVGHMITMFHSESLWGPFMNEENVNPLFTNRDRASEPLQNIGHADLFQDPIGNWWLTCLGTRPATVGFTQITNLGRETLLYPVIWEDKWPKIYQGTPTVEVDLADYPQHVASLTNEQKLVTFTDEFISDSLHPEWLSLRSSLADRLHLSPNQLILEGCGNAFEDLGTPSFLGVRQTEHAQSFKVQVDGSKTQLNDGMVGVASLINSDHYAAILVEVNDKTGSYRVFRKQKVGDIEINDVIGELSQLPDSFEIISQPDTKTFAVRANGETHAFNTQAIHFSNEAIAALNTGDIQGIYVLGDAYLSVSKVERTNL